VVAFCSAVKVAKLTSAAPTQSSCIKIPRSASSRTPPQLLDPAQLQEGQLHTAVVLSIHVEPVNRNLLSTSPRMQIPPYNDVGQDAWINIPFPYMYCSNKRAREYSTVWMKIVGHPVGSNFFPVDFGAANTSPYSVTHFIELFQQRLQLPPNPMVQSHHLWHK